MSPPKKIKGKEAEVEVGYQASAQPLCICSPIVLIKLFIIYMTCDFVLSVFYLDLISVGGIVVSTIVVLCVGGLPLQTGERARSVQILMAGFLGSWIIGCVVLSGYSGWINLRTGVYNYAVGTQDQWSTVELLERQMKRSDPWQWCSMGNETLKRFFLSDNAACRLVHRGQGVLDMTVAVLWMAMAGGFLVELCKLVAFICVTRPTDWGSDDVILRRLVRKKSDEMIDLIINCEKGQNSRRGKSKKTEKAKKNTFWCKKSDRNHKN